MIKKLKVSFAFSPQKVLPVGEMLLSNHHAIYFQFDPLFVKGKLSPSPIKLKPFSEPQEPLPHEAALFDGLFGVFADSLPDGWGMMMMSRAMKKAGLDFAATSALDRLSYVGRRGMGALVYEPASDGSVQGLGRIDLAQLAAEVVLVLAGKSQDVLSELLYLGGSPGGARPKVLVGLERGVSDKNTNIISGVEELPENFEHWLVKFRGSDERADAGLVEFIYSETARQVGINMPATRLLSDAKGGLWFGAKRFDRGAGNTRIHMHTAAGIVHANFRVPSLDYDDLLKITSAVTRHNDDVLAAFRLAAFNVIFHNRDDHAKNFAFTMSEQGEWRLSPAYDLTYSPGPGGEHSTAILGEGKFPTKKHLLELAKKRGIKKIVAQAIIQEIEDGQVFMTNLLRQYEIKNHPLHQILKRS